MALLVAWAHNTLVLEGARARTRACGWLEPAKVDHIVELALHCYKNPLDHLLLELHSYPAEYHLHFHRIPRLAAPDDRMLIQEHWLSVREKENMIINRGYTRNYHIVSRNNDEFFNFSFFFSSSHFYTRVYYLIDTMLVLHVFCLIIWPWFLFSRRNLQVYEYRAQYIGA